MRTVISMGRSFGNRSGVMSEKVKIAAASVAPSI